MNWRWTGYISSIILSLMLIADVGYTYLTVTGPTIYNIHSTGIVTQGSALFKVCKDPTGIEQVNDFSWGALSPGQTASVQLYIINTGPEPAVFTVATELWNPAAAEQYLDFTYTIGTTPLKPGQFRKVTFTIYVEPTITSITDFNFEVVVTGTS
jgi:hypothetical protein